MTSPPAPVAVRVTSLPAAASVKSPPAPGAAPPPAPQRADSGAVVAAAAPDRERREPARDAPVRVEKPSPAVAEAESPSESADPPPPEPARPGDAGREEANGVGDKIKIFEKAAEDAASAGRPSRPGSVRRPRAERLPSDELPPPPEPEPAPERPAPAPQRIVRPEFRPLASPAEITIRSPSLGSKGPERFPSHGTAFRNVSAAPAPAGPPDGAEDDEEHARAPRGRAAGPRGAGYFTRGSEEIWLVKKKDIEEIEERVLDSFRRAGRGRRGGYARSESLEAGGAGRAHTLKRQASVACTCGHDKKPRARPAAAADAPRPRSRSHGDPGDAAVLDKYETLV